MRVSVCMFKRMNVQRCERACIEDVKWNKRNRIPTLILEILSELSMSITCLIIIRYWRSIKRERT